MTLYCDNCGREIDNRKEDDRRALREKDIVFPNHKKEECAVVCTDCYKKIMQYLAAVN